MESPPVRNNVGFLPQRSNRLRIRVPVCLPRALLNRPGDLVQRCCAPCVCRRECRNQTAMLKERVQVDAIRRLERVCDGVRVRRREEGGGLWGERSEDGLEEVASGQLERAVDVGLGVDAGLVGGAGF